MDDYIDFNDFRAVQNISKNDNQRTTSYLKNENNNFQFEIEKLKNKMISLINNNEKYKNDNIIQKILDENINVSSKFKTKKDESSLKNKIDNKIIMKNKSKQNLLLYDNTNFTQNNEMTFNTGENLINKSNDGTNLCTNVQNIYIQDKQNKYPNLNEISSRINLPNNLKENQILYNINSSSKPFNINDINLLGNKRSSGNVSTESKKEKIYKEIKALCEKYKNDEKVGVKIYETENGFFERNETVIIEKPICVIYFYRKLINKIYLIREKNLIEDDKEIIEVLNEVKLKMDKIKKKFD
jgi:hypothetical protein